MVAVTCGYCGRSFLVYPSQIKKGGGRYCSHSHAALAREPYERTPEHKRKMSEALRGRPANPKAVEAGAAARRGKPPSDTNRATTSAMISGQSNMKWRDGRSFERYGPGYWKKSLRIAVIERDKVCQDCGEWFDVPRAMHVHHIDNARTNHSLDNLVLLCRPCHLRRHLKLRQAALHVSV